MENHEENSDENIYKMEDPTIEKIKIEENIDEYSFDNEIDQSQHLSETEENSSIPLEGARFSLAPKRESDSETSSSDEATISKKFIFNNNESDKTKQQTDNNDRLKIQQDRDISISYRHKVNHRRGSNQRNLNEPWKRDKFNINENKNYRSNYQNKGYNDKNYHKNNMNQSKKSFKTRSSKNDEEIIDIIKRCQDVTISKKNKVVIKVTDVTKPKENSTNLKIRENNQNSTIIPVSPPSSRVQTAHRISEKNGIERTQETLPAIKMEIDKDHSEISSGRFQIYPRSQRFRYNQPQKLQTRKYIGQGTFQNFQKPPPQYHHDFHQNQSRFNAYYNSFDGMGSFTPMSYQAGLTGQYMAMGYSTSMYPGYMLGYPPITQNHGYYQAPTDQIQYPSNSYQQNYLRNTNPYQIDQNYDYSAQQIFYNPYQQ